MNIFLFTMQGCDYCKEVKEMLKTEGIEYQEHDINEESEKWDSFKEFSGFDHVPQFLIKTKIGFTNISDFETLEEAVEELKTLISNNK